MEPIIYDSKIDTLAHIDKVRKNLKYITDQLEDSILSGDINDTPLLYRIHMRDIIDRLLARGLMHDVSKLDSFEKNMYDEYVPKLKKAEYGTEEYKNILSQMGPALEHHYKSNRHHPEYFENNMNDMHIVDVVETMMDFKGAADVRYQNILDTIDYNQERFGYDNNLHTLFVNTFSEMQDIPYEGLTIVDCIKSILDKLHTQDEEFSYPPELTGKTLNDIIRNTEKLILEGGE